MFRLGEGKVKSLLSPPPVSPIATPPEEQKEHEDNENKIHIFLQNIWREFAFDACWVRDYHSPASDYTYIPFSGAANEMRSPSTRCTIRRRLTGSMEPERDREW